MKESRYWAVVPAAGVGARMGAALPKQYLPLGGRTVIEETLDRLCGHPAIAGVVVALGAEDGYWADLAPRCAKPLHTVVGGAERCHSVRNALQRLRELAGPEEWVLVHDAARPCLRHADIDRLLERLAGHPVGGLLGYPVRDTMKRTDAVGAIVATVEREGLWHALTPQMFRLGPLHDALTAAIAGGALVTDEAAAMELAGHAPLMVEGHADNLKITHPEDLPLAEFHLRRRRGGE